VTENEQKKVAVKLSPDEYVQAKIKMAKSGDNWQSLLYQLFKRWLSDDERVSQSAGAELEDILEDLGLKASDVLLVTQIVDELRKQRHAEMLKALRYVVAAMQSTPEPPPAGALQHEAIPDGEPESA